jgi:hypothetical protein
MLYRGSRLFMCLFGRTSDPVPRCSTLFVIKAVGWMAPAVAALMWHHVNLKTELVLVMQGRYIPITYSRHLLGADESPAVAAPYRRGGALHLEPFPGTYSDGLGSFSFALIRRIKARREKPAWASAQAPAARLGLYHYNPKHGRPARSKLYPAVLRLLEVCRAALA